MLGDTVVNVAIRRGPTTRNDPPDWARELLCGSGSLLGQPRADGATGTFNRRYFPVNSRGSRAAIGHLLEMAHVVGIPTTSSKSGETLLGYGTFSGIHGKVSVGTVGPWTDRAGRTRDGLDHGLDRSTPSSSSTVGLTVPVSGCCPPRWLPWGFAVIIWHSARSSPMRRGG